MPIDPKWRFTLWRVFIHAVAILAAFFVVYGAFLAALSVTRAIIQVLFLAD